MLPASRIVLVGESPHAHEVEAIQFAVGELPGTDPYRVWGLVELLEPTTGRLYEIDLLVLGYSALYLVEIKSGPGRYEGDSVDWYRTPPDAPRRWMEPPLRLANQKARILKTRLRSKMRSPDRAPFIQPLVFLSAPDADLCFSPEGRIAVVHRRELAAALTRHQFPGSPEGWRAERIDGPTAADVAQALGAIGIRKRRGKLFAGAYELGPLLDDGTFQPPAEGGGPGAPSGYQDRIAVHRDTPGLTRRARVYLVPQQTTVARRQLLRRAADREVQLLYSVREHPSVLTFVEYVTDAPLGPTVLFDAFEGGVPLDAFLRQNPDLPFDDRVALVQQIARALAYCHKKDVRHGALGPHAVLVRRDADGNVQARLFNFQLGAGHEVRSTVHWSALASEPWAVYQAPELREEAGGPTSSSDVFSLGALAYLVFTGRPPAASVGDLDARLAREHHLDPRAVDDAIAAPIAAAIVFATERAVAVRADDAGEWIEVLLDQLTAPEPASAAPQIDPLEARSNDLLDGDLTVRAVLGHGATSRVLHVERASDRRAYALKISLSPEHDERLVEEARLLRQLDHARIARVIEQRTIADRTCLLLTLAGEQTLQRFLAREGTVSLDYAGRFGEDLLSALEELEEKNVVHRDIKPANVGVGSPGKGAVHLTLFDFSLGLAPLTELGVGTAVYRDPFLRRRGAWDAAADRWSAAITLHEMLTGVRPTVTDETPSDGAESKSVTIAAERFDPAVRDGLVAFFEKALHPDAELRFVEARAMRRAWLAAFEAPAAPAPAPRPLPDVPPVSGQLRAEHATAVWDPALLTAEQLGAIRPDTPAGALPLSARARNALDRAGVLRAQDLLDLPDNRLSSVKGVGRRVAQEILGLRDRWRAVYTPPSAAPAPLFAPEYRGEDLLLSATGLDPRVVTALADAGLHSLLAVASAPAAQVSAIAARAGGSAKALAELIEREGRAAGERARPPTVEAWLAALLPASKKRMAHLQLLYGLADPFAGRLDVTVREVADLRGVTTANVYLGLSAAREAWAKHPAIAELCDLGHAILDEAGGALPGDRAAAALLARLPHDRSAPEALLRARAAALFRVVDEVEHGRPVRLRVMRLSGNAIWVLAAEEHKPVIEALGRTADDLAARAILASPGEAARNIAGAAAGTPLAALPAERLADLAAAASRRAALSTRLEIYPRGLPAERALDLSAAVLASGLGPDEIQRRVAARYPDASPLPDRPDLDLLLQPHGLLWDALEGRYVRPGAGEPTSLATTSRPLFRLPTAATGQDRAMDPEAMDARTFDEKIAHAVDRGLLRVLGVRADLAEDAALALARRIGVDPVSLDAELIAAMKRQMAALDVDPAVVHEADRLGPAGAAWQNIVRLAELGADDVAARLLPPSRPLVLVTPGLLARYRLTGFLTRLVEASRRRESAAIFLLVPAHDAAGLPLINEQLSIPGVLPSDGLWVSPHWLANKHNAAA